MKMVMKLKGKGGDIFFWSTIPFFLILDVFIVIPDLWNYDISFSIDGVNTFKDIILQHKVLLGATLTMITVYIGYRSLKVAEEDSKLKLKESHFTEWRAVLDSRILDVETSTNTNSMMRRGFTRVRRNYFELLYAHAFDIPNKDVLVEVFQPFEQLAICFEHKTYQYCNGNVSSGTPFSLKDFCYLFLGCVNSYYDSIMDDLEPLYKNAIAKYKQ